MTREGAAAVGERVVLVAEDSLVVRTLLRHQLLDRGYAVVEAADGEQALARVRERAPDVVLLDVEMPKLDGFAVLAELKRDPALAGIPVILVSGRTTAADAARGLELGAQDYLRKPFEAAELTARVHAAMRTKALQDELRDARARLAGRAADGGVAGRLVLEAELARLCSRSARHGRPLAVLLVDVGEDGDEPLEAVGERLRLRLRAGDLLGSWAAGRLLVVAPETGEPGALALGRALLGVAAGGAVPRAAIGVAAWRGDGREELLSRAGAALAAARAGGDERLRAG